MVDLRPLLFVNFLMILLLIMAGFSSLDDTHDTKGSTTLESSVAPSKAGSPSNSTPNNQNILTAKKLKNKQEQAEITASSETEGQALVKGLSENDKVIAAMKQADSAAFNDEAIFADEVNKPQVDDSISSSFNATISPDDFVQLKMPAPLKEATTSASISSATITSRQIVKQPIKTGKIIVRSNVTDDMVLVNGKPYGPTKLELELTPGTYSIEVAKEGFQDWTSQVNITRGASKTVNAQLERYTKVNFKNGTWTNNIQTGEGRYIEEGKFEYNGSFVNGKFHGNGSIRYSNGMKYQGNWFEGSMQGNGSLTTTTGDTYIGEMGDNKFNGEGTLTKATGDIYTGFWIDGVLNGQGSLTTQNGLLYVGGFSDNLFHGNGSLTYPDGGQYEGSFSNGMFHGKGVEIYPNGKKYVGQFIDGLYHGKGEILNPNGSKITGTFKDGKPFGKATLTTSEGEVFTARSSEPGVCYRQKSYRATECPKLEGW